MPFQSKAQMRMMFAQHPKMAKEWAKETPNIKSLPEHKGMISGNKHAFKHKKK